MQRTIPFLLTAIFILAIATQACTPAIPSVVSLPDVSRSGWNHSDLRWIGAGDASDPQLDLIAAYARNTGSALQIRLDFLEFRSAMPFDIYLALDNASGGENQLPMLGTAGIRWNELLIFTAGSEPVTLTPVTESQETTDAALSLKEDFDGLVIHLDARFLIPGTTFQVFITQPGSSEIIDSTSPIALNGSPPAPAPLLLAFWETLLAATPAQAMRRWNGAHTGPLGQRHGLFQLLHAADRNDIPLALLDIKNPASLAALAAMDQLQWVHALHERGLLILPDNASSDPETAIFGLDHSRFAGNEYGFQHTGFLFAPITGTLPEGYQAAFYVTGDERIIQTSGGRLVPLPAAVFPEEGTVNSMDEQVNRAGLTLSTKRRLLDTALSNDPSRITVLGGRLPDSHWADSSITSLAFATLANHPWIQVLDQEALLSLPAAANAGPTCPDLLCAPLVLPFKPYTTAGNPVENGPDSVQLREILRTELDASPAGNAKYLAWQMYQNLTVPSTNAYRQALQANYLGQIGHLLYIARWAENPIPLNHCTSDLDWDGNFDCVLATNTFISTFKLDGGRMLFAGSLHEGEWIQWIGPASQLLTGSGEQREWQIQRGVAADPNEIPGAFTTQTNPFAEYTPSAGPDSLTFHSNDGTKKTYHLMPAGFTFTYRSSQPAVMRLPLILSPQSYWLPERTFDVPAIYQSAISPDERVFTWGLEQGPQLLIESTSSNLQATTFIDALEWLGESENPERAYPPGHFLPFPLAVVELSANDNFTLQISQK
jgi:hypothetical protein